MAPAAASALEPRAARRRVRWIVGAGLCLVAMVGVAVGESPVAVAMWAALLGLAGVYVDRVLELERRALAVRIRRELGAVQGGWEWSPDTGLTTVSADWLAMLGHDPTGDAPVTGFWDAVHPDDRERVLAARDACLRGETPTVEVEHRYAGALGADRWLLLRARVAERDPAGRPVRVVGSHHDIAERKAAEGRARDLARHLEAVLDAASDVGIVATDVDGRITLFNHAAELLYGYAEAEVVGRTPLAFHDLAQVEERVRELTDALGRPIGALEALTHGGPEARDWTQVRKDGSRFIGALVVRAIPADLGVRGYVGVVQDVTERRRQEQAVRLAASVYDVASEGMIVADANNRILAVNPAFTRITGYTPAEAIGQDPRFLGARRQGPLFWSQVWGQLRSRGSWQGEVWNRRKDGEVVSVWLSITTVRRPDGSPERFVGLLTDLSERKRSEDLLWEQANLDALTGLANRRALYDRLELDVRAVPYEGGSVYALVVDLDRFKELRDGLGHERADRILVEIGRRVAAGLPPTATAARLNGDEFCVVVPHVAEREEIELLARRMLGSIVQPVMVDGHAAYVSASIGIAAYPDDATDADELLKHADQAMYLSKKAGRARHGFFVHGLQRVTQVRMGLASDLHGALAGGQFSVWYQPIVDLRTGQCHRAEALLRWHHPHRGMVSPKDFVPLLEETGLIDEVSDWVLDQASACADRWSSRIGADFVVAVNRSPVRFHEGQGWADRVRAAGRRPELVTVEITEGMLLQEDPRVLERLHALREAGMRVCIDDFGTGYSSLAYLRRFPVDTLKIDQAFVRTLPGEPSDRVMVESILGMARKLGLGVVAEGVETVAQRDWLIAEGCAYGQGYLFARPMPQEEFEARFVEAAVQRG